MISKIKEILKSKSSSIITEIPVLGKYLTPLTSPDFWKLRKHSVAKGAAVGAFFAFVTPVAQIPLSVLCAFLFRFHIPSAIAATFINTPLTFGPVYFAAHWLGAKILHQQDNSTSEQVFNAINSFDFSFGPVLQATFLGAFIFGVCAAFLSYCLVLISWKLKAIQRAKRLKQFS